LKAAQLKELRRCAHDFPYFCSRYLKILDKRKRLVLLDFNPIQSDFVDVMTSNPFTYVLKSRKVGITTLVAARFFWQALFRPGFEVAVIAHTEKAVLENIAPIYHRFYEHLPKFMRMPLKHQTSHKLHFAHDSRIIIGTANSEGARGGTPVALHCSEFSRYENPDDTMAALFNSLGDDPQVVLETTAAGMNFAYSMWIDDELEYHRVFYPWTEDPTCRKKDTGYTVPAELEELAEEFELTTEQVSWYTETYKLKCNSKMRILQQEYPIVADHAFVSSGGRFFHAAYPDGEPEPGYVTFSEPTKWHTYVMGVDTASGAYGGDYSAFCVIDVTVATDIKTVASFYDHLMPRAFGKRVHAEALKWGALVVPEANSYGLTIIEELRIKNYPYIYHKLDQKDGEHTWTKKYGFWTDRASRPLMLSKLYEALYEGWFDACDPRFRCEANHFTYSAKGKPQAQPGHHDDMVIATALAIYGANQAAVVREDRMMERPENIRESLQFEARTGRSYTDDWDDWHESDVNRSYPLAMEGSQEPGQA